MLNVIVDETLPRVALTYKDIIGKSGLYEDDSNNYIYVDADLSSFIVICSCQIFALDEDEARDGGYTRSTYNPVKGELTLRIISKGT